MSERIEQINLGRAQSALNRVRAVRDSNDKRLGDDYCNAIEAFPFSARALGLGQALALLCAAGVKEEGRGHRQLYRDLQSWLTQAPHSPYSKAGDLHGAHRRRSSRLPFGDDRNRGLFRLAEAFRASAAGRADDPGAGSMTMRPLYNPLARDGALPEACRSGGNRGLWYDKLFDQWTEAGWSVRQPDRNHPGGKRDWIDRARSDRCGDADLLAEAAERTKALVRQRRGVIIEAATAERFVTGTGLPHPIENGFLWHHTLGVPYLPGSGVKGIVLSWDREWANDFERTEANRAARPRTRPHDRWPS